MPVRSIDFGLLTRYRRQRAELESLGIAPPRPNYRIDPPLFASPTPDARPTTAEAEELRRRYLTPESP